jgi:hypothetical protein
MLLTPPPFPDHLPEGYAQIAEDYIYDPDRHLQLEFPDRIWTLEEFGYDQSDISNCASNIAVTSPFRILSDLGIRELNRICSNLKSTKSNIAGKRVPSHLSGGVYKSKFLRDFCNCPVILDHMSTISGTSLLPHSMPSQQIYINYAPDDISKAVDAWHFDGIGFDYVLMMSDPSNFEGGDFEYFKGTKYEVAEMLNLEVHEVRYGISRNLPQNQVIKARFPGAGYGIFQQGNMIVHRAAKLLSPADRITIVPGLVSQSFTAQDPTAKHDMPGYNEPGIETELARHAAWIAQAKLQNFVETASLYDSPELIVEDLRRAIADVTATIKYIAKGGRSEPVDT